MNERQFNQHLADIAFRNPGEPLLPVLRGGWSRLNVLYMGVALKRMPTLLEEDEQVVEILPGTAVKATVTFKTGAPDETLRKLWAERTRLFGEMNKQSNMFHLCTTNEGRAEVSRKVMGIWQQILRVKGNILYYEDNGELPKVVQAEDSLSDNPATLVKQLSSYRAQISQTKAKLASIAGLDPSTPRKEDKISELEAKLRDLTHLKGLAEQKMRSYEQQ